MGVTGKVEKDKFLQRRTRRRRNSCGRTDEGMGLLKQEVLAALKSKRLQKMKKLFEGWLQQSVYLLSKMPWQILLLAVRNPYETLGNTSKTPSPSLTTSKCASTCDEFFPNCFVVFQARCCILLPKIVIPEQRCLKGRNSVSLSDPFLQWSSTGGGVPRTFCLGSRQTLLPNFQMQGFQVRG